MERLLGSPSSNSQPSTNISVTSTPVSDRNISSADAENDFDTDEESEDLSLYLWYFESADLAKLIIALKCTSGVRYTTTRVDDHTVQVTAVGEMSSEEISCTANVLGVPDTMLRVRFPSWTKKQLIHTDHQVTGAPQILTTVGNLKVVYYPLHVLRDDIVLQL